MTFASHSSRSPVAITLMTFISGTGTIPRIASRHVEGGTSSCSWSARGASTVMTCRRRRASSSARRSRSRPAAHARRCRSRWHAGSKQARCRPLTLASGSNHRRQMQQGRFVVGIGPLGCRSLSGGAYAVGAVAGSGEQRVADRGERRRRYHGVFAPAAVGREHIVREVGRAGGEVRRP